MSEVHHAIIMAVRAVARVAPINVKTVWLYWGPGGTNLPLKATYKSTYININVYERLYMICLQQHFLCGDAAVNHRNPHP